MNDTIFYIPKGHINKLKLYNAILVYELIIL